MRKLMNKLRIGTKLALVSGLGIVFVVGMIVNQMIGSGSVARSTEAADTQRVITQFAAEIKASVRGLMVGARDTRLADTPEALEKATRISTPARPR